MNGFIWLASYPRSGNTWFRLLAASLALEGDAAPDINDLIGHSAGARLAFDAITLLDSALLSAAETDRLRPGAYRAMADGAYRDPAIPTAAPAPPLMKVHDAYRYTPGGQPVFAGARGAIVMVRDPRAVAASLAGFLSCTVDRAIEIMASDDYALGRGLRSWPHHMPQTVESWSANVAGWMTQTDVPVHLVRYEDIRRDTAGVFRDAMAFAGATVSPAQAEQAAARAGFSTLRAQETAHGFREWSALKRSSDARFFRRGEAEGWRDELTAAQIARIEARHGDIMDMLGYTRATAPDPLLQGTAPCA
ncbi:MULTISPECIES: sulfotransferase domain-containing protein [unclassified Sphingomonas]|uniref:sulfotransferase domain-containing protein n=1 Tax=unclassified Sphingomonas TaxID=196159 RepID=UPI0006F4FC61|nr:MULTISPECIES: sulfotransferase domain-containing protein [unclassified Sphingomonas]KQX19464.1 hypothetical protein ASD17_13125 [Sphingomonas sp. Root1294]KQY65665.1 hypothetical protein ASD39_16325 [Sphingomonas sp. Root50]